MVSCKIIEDLLPSYCDGLTGEESNAMIREHIASCPQCAALLNKMSETQQIPVADHRESFREKMKEYAHKHTVRRLGILLGCALAVLLVVLLWCNSQTVAKWMMVKKTGGKPVAVALEVPAENNSLESYYVCHTGEDYALVTLAKHPVLKVWYMKDMHRPDDNSYTISAWFGDSNHRWYNGENLSVDFEINYLYIGNNAVAPIVLAEEDIPGDVFVKVNQQGENYWIHVVSDNSDALNQLQIIQLLESKGYIA